MTVEEIKTRKDRHYSIFVKFYSRCLQTSLLDSKITLIQQVLSIVKYLHWLMRFLCVQGRQKITQTRLKWNLHSLTISLHIHSNNFLGVRFTVIENISAISFYRWKLVFNDEFVVTTSQCLKALKHICRDRIVCQIVREKSILFSLKFRRSCYLIGLFSTPEPIKHFFLDWLLLAFILLSSYV